MTSVIFKQMSFLLCKLRDLSYNIDLYTHLLSQSVHVGCLINMRGDTKDQFSEETTTNIIYFVPICPSSEIKNCLDTVYLTFY